MASAAEQLASNINFSTFAKAKDLKQRILFTLGALLIYRLGTFIPLPGINTRALNDLFQQNQSGILGMFDMFAGGAVGRMAIFALNIMPYISAAIIMQLLVAVSPALGQMRKEGERGRKQINQYTRYGTVFLAALQAWGISIGLEGAGDIVIDPGLYFRMSAVITLVGGVVFLMWIGEQVTARGIGNGISLIIFAGIVAELPSALVNTLELGRQGALSTWLILAVILLAIAVIVVIVYVERAQRRLIVQYPRRQQGNKIIEGDSSHLPLKINTAGVIPPIFASSLLLLPMTVANFSTGQGPEWLNIISSYLGRGAPLYLTFYISLIVFFAFFYTAIVFNPSDTADNLKRQGGFIPGIRPGENTSKHIDYVLTRLTTVGTIYLALVALLPEFLISRTSIPFYLGGTSLLIIVVVMIDFITQVQSHLFQHQYEGLLKKTKLKGRR